MAANVLAVYSRPTAKPKPFIMVSHGHMSLCTWYNLALDSRC